MFVLCPDSGSDWPAIKTTRTSAAPLCSGRRRSEENRLAFVFSGSRTVCLHFGPQTLYSVWPAAATAYGARGVECLECTVLPSSAKWGSRGLRAAFRNTSCVEVTKANVSACPEAYPPRQATTQRMRTPYTDRRRGIRHYTADAPRGSLCSLS